MNKDLDESVELHRILETARKRPLPGTNIDNVLGYLIKLLEAIPVSVLNKHTPKGGPALSDVIDELQWVTGRWNVFESGLMRIAQGLNQLELKELLEYRRDVLYWILDKKNFVTTNEEIIALCKGSLNPKFTNTIQFEIPPGYKGGNPLRLMEEAMKSIKVYERNYGPYVPEPNYLLIHENEDGTVRRFIDPEWIDWWGAYTDHKQNPLQVATERMYEHFKDRPDLKHLDVRVRDVAEPKVVDDDRVQYEVLVTYQASI